MEHVVCHGRNYSQLNVGNIWLLRVLEGLSCNSSYLSVSTKANAIFRIFDNLRNMDFGEDLTFLMQLSLTHDSDSQFPLFDKHPLVNLSRELTSVCELASLFWINGLICYAAWSRIKSRLAGYMETVRHHRLARHRLIVVHRRHLDLAVVWCELLRRRPIPHLVPRTPDLSEFACVRSLMHAPVEIVVTRSLLETVVESLGDSVLQWRSNNTELLLSIVQPFLPAPTQGRDNCHRLQLATCVLMCTAPVSNGLTAICRSTKEFMWYPQFFDHCCNHYSNRHSRPYLVEAELGIGDFCSEAFSVVQSSQHTVWTADHLKLNDRASSMVKHILMACGVDFNEASIEYVDTLNLYVVCLDCHFNQPSQRFMTIMSWRRAVSLT